MNSNLFGKSLDEVAIERIQTFASAANGRDAAGYWVAFSGGKDSCVVLDLVKRAGVPFEAHHSLTTVDPPELVRFVKTFPEVQIDRPDESMWQLIRRKGMPPRRAARFCCEVLKERGGDGRLVVTGVRWEESTRRSRRRMVESCYRSSKGRRFLHPIIDWSTSDVWQYIRERGLRYCSLYDEGFKRVGCVLCPMTRDVQRHMERWPKLCAAWERAVKATWKPDSEKKHVFSNPDEYWRWWLNRDAPGLDDSPVLFEDDPAEGRAGHV
jgi:phosphoadenosine phosphosulfate reductase